ncbi:MAG: helix-turn-helix transcriptional regulator [Thermoguttaceae bacterium]|jgi:predicted transcriptional regulator
MAKRQAKRMHRDLTSEEKKRWQQARKETEIEKEDILAQGQRIKAAHNRVRAAVRDALKFLKAERQAQGLSLSDVEERSGIGRPALSRLENETDPNPTVVTLTRYAEALGKKLVVSFE